MISADLADRLVDYVAEHPDCSCKEVARAIGVSVDRARLLAHQLHPGRIVMLGEGLKPRWRLRVAGPAEVVSLRRVHPGLWRIGDDVVSSGRALELAAQHMVRADRPDVAASEVEDLAVDLLLGESP